MSFVVMTDTSGNLPRQYVLDYSLEIIPFSYFIDGKEYNSVKDPDFDAEESDAAAGACPEGHFHLYVLGHQRVLQFRQNCGANDDGGLSRPDRGSD